MEQEIVRNSRPNLVRKHKIFTYVNDETLELLLFLRDVKGISVSHFLNEAAMTALSKSNVTQVTTSLAIRKQAILGSFDRWFERFVTLESIALYEPGRPKGNYPRQEPTPFFAVFAHYLENTPAWQHCTKIMFAKKMRENIPDYKYRYGRFSIEKRQEWSIKGIRLADKFVQETEK